MDNRDWSPRPIKWSDLHDIYKMQMEGFELKPERTAAEGERIAGEMRHELHSLIWDVEKGRQS